jgi:hypothetical protein
MDGSFDEYREQLFMTEQSIDGQQPAADCVLKRLARLELHNSLRTPCKAKSTRMPPPRNPSAFKVGLLRQIISR